MASKNRIWERIERAMKANQYNMPELAIKSKVTRQTLYNVKKTGTCSLKTLDKIAAALGIDRAYFLS